MAFPHDFTWGVATAAYQIEDSALRAGGGASVWDMFCSREGAIDNGDTGWESCNHYDRYKQDVALMGQLGVNGYRMSLSWPRIMPDGTGKISEEGLGFYDRLVDELLDAGIAPWVTLFHWDYPSALYNRGGWLNPDSSHWFADYTQVVVDRLSDRVKNWMTLNEPQCFIGLGHLQGIHAPGEKMQLSQVLLAAHNALLAHGRAVQVIRASAKSPDTKIGYAPVGVCHVPATDDPADVDAARAKTFSVAAGDNLWNSTWWMDPVLKGEYPEDGLVAYGKDAPKPAPGDLETMNQPLDFFGANIYHATLVKAGADGGKPETAKFRTGLGRTAFMWPVVPECLYWGPKFFYERYGKPIVVTENGLANTDWVHLDGKVHDPARIDFLHRHLREFHRAQTEGGVEIMGYFQWSFMDNFEWAEGYKMRFGMVHVDYPTQTRTPKDSYYWYKDVIAANGKNL